MRLLRPSQLDDPNHDGTPVVYVPWAATVAGVLDGLLQQRRDVAVVLDEYGSWLGVLTIDEILRRTLLDRPTATVQTLRLPGGESIGDVARRLDVTIDTEGVSTLGGYIQRHNERLPRVGDSAPMPGFECVVVAQGEEDSMIEIKPITEDPTRSGATS